MLNTELMIVIRDFCEHALLSLNRDYRNYLTVDNAKDSKILKLIDLDHLDNIITDIMEKMILKGNIYIYFYKSNKKIYIRTTPYEKEKEILKKKIKFPSFIMNNLTRKRMIYKLKNIDSTKILGKNVSDVNYARNFVYMSKLANNEVLKITKGIHYNSSNTEIYSDIYHLYSVIRMKRNQLKFVNYIINFINENLNEILELKNKEKILFVGINEETLNNLEEKLLNSSDSLLNISNHLFNNINFEN